MISLAESHNRKSISSLIQLITSLRRKSKENLELSKRIQAPEDKVIMKDLEEKMGKKGKEDLEEKMVIDLLEDNKERDHLEDKEKRDKLEDKMDKEDLEETMIESLDLNKDKIEDLEDKIIINPRSNGLRLVQLSPERKI